MSFLHAVGHAELQVLMDEAASQGKVVGKVVTKAIKKDIKAVCASVEATAATKISISSTTSSRSSSSETPGNEVEEDGEGGRIACALMTAHVRSLFEYRRLERKYTSAEGKLKEKTTEAEDFRARLTASEIRRAKLEELSRFMQTARNDALVRCFLDSSSPSPPRAVASSLAAKYTHEIWPTTNVCLLSLFRRSFCTVPPSVYYPDT